MAEWERLKLIAQQVKPIGKGRINVWYDHAGRFCDVIWFTGNTYFYPAEHDDVMALVDLEGNLFGFKINDVSLVNAGQDGYVNVNLKSRLKGGGVKGSVNGHSGQTRSPETAMPGLEKGNPIEQGLINFRYGKDSHFFDVFWAAENTRYIETGNRHALALVNAEGILCGFRIIDLDRLSGGEDGYINVDLFSLMAPKPA